MLELKNILLENNSDKIRQFLNDCTPFIKRNYQLLDDGFAVLRGAGNKYGKLAKRNFMKRK